jgi:poly(hydroxyalkanoate) granule-associated protein
MKSRVKRVAAGMARGGFEAARTEALAVARTLWLAGLGAAATAGEAGVATFEALVEKGRRRRETPVERLERQIAATRRDAAKAIETTGRAAYRQVAGVLEQLGVPKQSEIRALRARHEALRERLS